MRINTIKIALSLSTLSALIATVLVASPASADAEITLPTGVSVGDTSGLLTYACPSHVEVFAPMPTNTVDPLSPRELAQLGIFKWALEHSGSEASYTEATWEGTAESQVLSYQPETELLPGSEVQLALRASIYNGPVTYADEVIDFTVTVVDPSFAEGSGTIADPYIVTSEADMQKMRCYEFKHFKLANDLNLSPNWFPIGSNQQNWNGHFDGANFSINGLTTGHVSMYQAGLFGNVAHSSIKNLTIIDPVVVGSGRTGVLVGSARYGVTISNVKIEGARLDAVREAGLLAGHKDYGGLVNDCKVQGTITLDRTISRYYQDWSTLTKLNAGYVSDIGGLVGFDDGDGTTFLRNEVDVRIDVLPSLNLAQFAADNSMEIESVGNTYEIGGFVGEGDEDTTYEYNKVTSDINIESYGPISRIGGAFGTSESPSSKMTVDSDIHIVHLGLVGTDNEDIREIGGVVGYADDQTISYSNIVSQILIEAADGTNNSGNVDYSSNNLKVEEVGGMGGEWDDDTSDMYNRVKTDIVIRGVSTIQEVGGFVGLFDDDNSFGYTDNFVSGSINLNASTNIQSVGGFSNMRSSGALAGERNFAATTIETSGTAEVIDVNPFIGENVSPDRQMAPFSYWDASLNFQENPEGYPGLPASTSELKGSAFLTAAGMDFENVWQLSSGSYPELKQSVYTWGFSGSKTAINRPSTNVSRPDGPTSIILPKSVKRGSKVIVRGTNLNRVTDVYVAGKRVSYTLRTNGNLTFKAPNLATKKYLVRLDSVTAGTFFEKKIRLAAR